MNRKHRFDVTLVRATFVLLKDRPMETPFILWAFSHFKDMSLSFDSRCVTGFMSPSMYKLVFHPTYFTNLSDEELRVLLTHEMQHHITKLIHNFDLLTQTKKG